MKKFLYKFLVVILAVGMLTPTWITKMWAPTIAEAASFSHEYYKGEGSTVYTEKTSADWNDSSFMTGGRWTDNAGEYATWKFTPSESGEYAVSVNWVINSNQTDVATYSVTDKNGVSLPITVDQKHDVDESEKVNNTISQFKLLGTYRFDESVEYQVKIAGNIGSSKHLFAGHVKIDHKNIKPSKPELIFPELNSYINTKTPNLEWSDSSDADDTNLRYELYVDNNMDFSSAEIVKKDGSILSNSQYQVLVSDGLSQEKYYWAVRAWDNEDYSYFSTKGIFNIDTQSPARPTANPVGNTYYSSQNVSLDCSSPDKESIYYTLDGADPDKTKNKYLSPIVIDQSLSLRAVAYDTAGNISPVLYEAYIISTPSISGQEVSSISSTSAPKVVTTKTRVISQPVASEAPAPAVIAPATPATPPATTTPAEQGEIKGTDIEETSESEKINWTPWIILFILIILAGAATGGYFYWFGREDDEEIISKEVIEKSKRPVKKETKSASQKSKRW